MTGQLVLQIFGFFVCTNSYFAYRTSTCLWIVNNAITTAFYKSPDQSLDDDNEESLS